MDKPDKEKKRQDALVKQQDNKLLPPALLAMAIEKGADVDALEKLMNLQERWEAREAKKVFLHYISIFQNECPVLKKDKVVSFGQTRYSYAPLSSIAQQTKKLLQECGLSYRWEINEVHDGKMIQVTCIISHVDGHSESTSMTGSLDDSGKKNAIQQRGSTVTYLQRYTLIGALGITSAEDDPDAKGAPQSEQPTSEGEELMNDLKKKIAAYKTKKGLIDWVNNNEGYWELDGFQEAVRAKTATLKEGTT